MVQLETYTIALSYLRPDAPHLDEAELAALQNAHMADLAAEHEAGHLLAAGPVPSPELRGLSIFRLDPASARAISEQNPSVRAGRLRVEVHSWMVPAGAISFSRTRFPHSMAEVDA